MKTASYDEVVKFHGHSCPGLAIGYRMTLTALKKLRQFRAEDEELVAIVENDACGTDAVQFLSGCTFGKGNFIFHDYGKMVYTFYDRIRDKAVRVSRNPDFREKLERDDLTREEKIQAIMEAPVEKLLILSEVTIYPPEKARLYDTLICDKCGETVMATRIIQLGDRKYCLPCSGKDQKGKPNSSSDKERKRILT